MTQNNEEKLRYAKKLLKIGMSYRDIQFNLKLTFGTGMSNTTLKNLVVEEKQNEDWRIKYEQSQEELAVYKNLYFNLLKTLKLKLKDEKN
jgi:hypothetical protein